ncbi:MAG: chitobiase/beta-hexosaminidase C-terminal domain-containing protein [Deltaproteobacteria bacterium]|nr:chitobiase/beta-hexosaminidase C-terminal domain-containing protein [Deltaproteobacteria bacterium]
METPALSLQPGTYKATQSLTVTCGTPEAGIFYTIDKTDPTPASLPYSGPIEVSHSMTVSVRGFKSGWSPSEIVRAAFEITGVTAPPEFSIFPGAGGVFLQTGAVHILRDPQGRGPLHDRRKRAHR